MQLWKYFWGKIQIKQGRIHFLEFKNILIFFRENLGFENKIKLQLYHDVVFLGLLYHKFGNVVIFRMTKK